MRAHTLGRFTALTLLLGGLACAGNKAGNEGTVVAQDSTRVRDTSAYKGMERDTTAMPAPVPAPVPATADTTQYQPQPTAPTAPADTTGMKSDSSATNPK